ncbi:MAG: Holliday junction DNA helicase RuvA [Planctomycetia bacterium]|nr:Holliday junction DNA helicase RuvA [Planctomycetia bacterium]
MITRISGKLLALRGEAATLAVDSFHYEVLVPEHTRRQLQALLQQDVSLFTVDYLEGNPAHGRMTPRIVGFLSEAEREFFELFCSVDGVGVKKALRAMERPVREIAVAIEEQDAAALSTLPGVGPALAERIIAKLRRAMAKFALMVARDEPGLADIKPDLVAEAFGVLRGLGHSESDARRLIESVAATKTKFKDVQEVLLAIYQQRK